MDLYQEQETIEQTAITETIQRFQNDLTNKKTNEHRKCHLLRSPITKKSHRTLRQKHQ